MPDLPGQAHFNFDAPTERKRCRGAVQGAVLEFARLRLRTGCPAFHMGDLTRFVDQRRRTAPDTAGRILRALHRDGALSYELVSRARSEYRIRWVDAPQEDRAAS